MQTLDTEYRFTGDWSISGVLKQVETLSSHLQKLNSDLAQNIHIDCNNITHIDMSGLQLLHVWIECARMRGVEPKLINLPDRLKHELGRHWHVNLPVLHPATLHKH